ncbi:hypothetical protein [Clostridium botulinum]|uniref:hypothetical protein n=1 Tax=Clostridium botulinum TaxID=1491 RepID=UPI0006A6C011|nr:hypothetical protein [Clostridium botulinum]KOM95634.1 hypothetical protein ACP53_17445 [Clostridium botulinum]KOM99573.1 hypothetical protein ACP49_16645 [Clostridium botulinum]MBN3408126.1 hypothetical protein [Clostridium botulinum]MBY6872338.1 hypothetical protein [Clostridium botulinum]MBY6886312.1 hypothetical protein [Clostridium botulinum]
MATDNFYFVEGNTSVKNLVKTLATEITQNSGIYKWDLVYPDSMDKIGSTGEETTINLITDDSKTDKVDTVFTVGSQNDKCIIKATTTYGKEFYLKIDREKADLTKEEKKSLIDFDKLHTYYNHNGDSFSRTDAQVLEVMAGTSDRWSKSGDYNAYVSAKTKSNSINNIKLQISDKLNADKTDLGISKNIQAEYNYRLAWYRKLQPEIKDFLPVQYWINITKDSINLVLCGDPSADVHPYENYLTSYAYIGALKPVEDSAYTDDKYNFGITVSSDIEPNYSKFYGERTATGVTDVCMIANKIGMPYQPHYPAFYATNPFMDKCNVEGSRYNHKKHQFSDITLVHPVDMERGKMINVLVGDASAINDTDRLAYKKDTEEEEYYKKFKITAPYCFLNNSANINYCVAIRCYKTTK